MNDIIKISNLSIEYKDKKILQDASFSFSTGHVYLLVGTNGTGKSTFLKSLLGIERSSRKETGFISIEHSKNVLEMSDNDLQTLRSGVAYLEQKDFYESFYGVTVFDVLKDSYSAFLNKRLSKDDCEYIFSIFEKYSKNLSFGLKTKVNKLSGGQQRMLSIIASICLRNQSKVFIIDEPLNNLDINNVVDISNLLNSLAREKNDSVFLVVSHCKIFPFITDVVQLKDEKLAGINEKIECYSCFGQHDEKGYY